MLFLNLLLAGVLAVVCVLMHFGGLTLLIRLVRRHLGHLHDRHEIRLQALVVLAAVGGLFLLHTAEIWAYTLAIYAVGAMDDLTHALYFCISTYSTIGYGDVVLAEEWRVFGATQAVVGLLLMGWSTAFLVTVVGRLKAFAEH